MIYIDVHSHSAASSPDVVKVMDGVQEAAFFSAGLHPWHLTRETLEGALVSLEERLRLPSCIAVGETGLDKICKTPWALQLEAFTKQIELAESFSKPLIIHCVKAVQEVIGLKKQSRVPWIFHGFRSSPETAQSLVKKGFYLSFGSSLLDCEKTRSSFATVSLEKIFFETDEADVSIKKIYSEAAKLRNIPEEELCNLVKNNFITVFGDIVR